MGNILAVDDSEPMRKMVELVLKSAGHVVALATDGADGLQKFQQSVFDLIITDINMPNMGGLEFIRKVRSIDQQIPILVLTTEFDPRIQQRGQEAGANGWVVKPFKPAPFLDMVQQILSAR